MPEVEAFEIGQRGQLERPGIGDFGAVEVDGFEGGELEQGLDGGIGDRGGGKPEHAEFGRAGELGDGLIGDFGGGKIGGHQLRENGGELGENGIIERAP